jgi:hypothetical protein
MARPQLTVPHDHVEMGGAEVWCWDLTAENPGLLDSGDEPSSPLMSTIQLPGVCRIIYFFVARVSRPEKLAFILHVKNVGGATAELPGQIGDVPGAKIVAFSRRGGTGPGLAIIALRRSDSEEGPCSILHARVETA